MIDAILWGILIVGCLALYVSWRFDRPTVKESFLNQSGQADTAAVSTVALDAAPTTSEVKGHYKNVLLWTEDALKKGNGKALKLISDFSDRHFKKRDLREKLKTSEVLEPWPKFLPPLDTSIDQDPPSVDVAANSERAILAYLQKNYPHEKDADEETRSMVRNLIEDIAYRFVYKKGEETMQLKDDYMKEELVKGWQSPISEPPLPLATPT